MEQSTLFGDFIVTTIVTAPPWYENCYLVQHRPSKKMVVIDPGGDAPRIATTIEESGATLEAIWLTHGHPDHVGGVAGLQDATGVPCRAHAKEEPVLTQVSAYAYAMTGESLAGPRSCEYFSGEPTLDLGGAEVQVFLSPGHTPGGVCFLFDGFAFTGDTLFNHGVGRTDFPGGNSRELADSIGRLLERLPDRTVLHSGHGPHWTAGEARHWWKGMRLF